MTDQRDTLFQHIQDVIPAFQFDEAVVNVFPDMIKRSVPGYSTIIHMIGQIAERYCQSQTRCYDLGCSVGTATLAMRHRIHASQVEIIGVDNSQAMIERCQATIDADAAQVPVTLVCDDIANVDISNASICVMNFTLQFIAPEKRLEVLTKIADGMNSGGILILSEKLDFVDTQHRKLMTELHHNFKKANGYSDLEVAQKRSALENVLVPERFDTHKARLIEAGFRSADLWFQCFNFSSMIAFK